MTSAKSWSAAPEIPQRRAFLSGALPRLDPRFAGLSAERLALLKDIAHRCEQRPPAGASPLLRANETCAGHGVCVSVCPTGALKVSRDEGFEVLDFSPGECIACGACVVVCPGSALTLEARRTGELPSGPERIAVHTLQTCSRCDDRFVAGGPNELCPACRKDIGLFTHGFPARSDGP